MSLHDIREKYAMLEVIPETVSNPSIPNPTYRSIELGEITKRPPILTMLIYLLGIGCVVWMCIDCVGCRFCQQGTCTFIESHESDTTFWFQATDRERVTISHESFNGTVPCFRYRRNGETYYLNSTFDDRSSMNRWPHTRKRSNGDQPYMDS